MLSSKITGKGQATIPKTIRSILKVKMHDHVEFKVRNGKVWIERMSSENKSLFGKYAHVSNRKKSVPVEEMNSVIKKRSHQ